MECVICYEEISEVNRCVLNCGHTFHTTCAMRFARHKDNCPLCRTTIGAEIHGNRCPPLLRMPVPFDKQTYEVIKSIHDLSKEKVISEERFQQVKNLIINATPLAE